MTIGVDWQKVLTVCCLYDEVSNGKYSMANSTNLEHLRFIPNLSFCTIDQGRLDDEVTVEVAPASWGVLCRDGSSESSESKDVLHDD